SYRMNVHADPTPRSDNKVSFRGGDMPIRSPFAHHGDLRRLGAALARGAHEHIEDIEPFEPRDRTKDNAERIRSVVHVLNRAQLDGESVTPAANWLLDNSHVIEQAIAAIRRDLPRRFYRQLPVMADLRVPRVLAIAWL